MQVRKKCLFNIFIILFSFLLCFIIITIFNQDNMKGPPGSMKGLPGTRRDLSRRAGEACGIMKGLPGSRRGLFRRTGEACQTA